MAQTIKLKRSATPSAIPSTASLSLGEVAINTYDGKMFIKKDDGTEAVVEIGSGGGGVSSFADNAKLTFGDSADLEIYHDGSNSYIADNGTGNLVLKGTNLTVESSTGENYFVALANADTRLYYDNAQKLATTSTGIDVTGTATMDGLTVDGNGEISSARPILDLMCTNATDENTRIDVNLGNLRLRTLNDAKTTAKERVSIDNATGDISFYEDTGTTPKLTWDASAESLNFADNGKAIFGAGSDLQIYHDGSNSIIYEGGTGDLQLRGNGGSTTIMNGGGTETLANFGNNGAVTLYHDNAIKLATTSTGIDITGTVTADGLTVNADALINSVTVGRGAGDVSTNTTVGNLALAANTSGANNVANGYVALRQNTTGSSNVATGSLALYKNTTGNSNVATGYQALYDNTDGDNNLATGYAALSNNTTGSNNVATGYIALLSNTTGSNNTALGRSAGNSLTTGSNNTVIGYNADASSATVSNETTIGNTSVTSTRIFGDISFYEDTGTTPKFFWDASAESLGVGTTSPFFTAAGRSSLSVNGTSSSILAFGKGGSSENYILADAGGFTIANTSATLPTIFFNNGAERMRIDSSGNIGIGVAPKTWLSSYDALQIGASGSVASITSGNENVAIGSNAYIATDGTLKYIATNEATRYLQSAGVHYWYSAASGTADSTIPFTQAMTLDASGNLLVGRTSTTTSNLGVTIPSSGAIQATANFNALGLNRLSGDGDIAVFQKSGTTVGSIGVAAGDNIYFAGGSGSTKGIYINDVAVYPANTGGAVIDNAVALGQSNYRWTDLYLSGIVTASGGTSTNWNTAYGWGDHSTQSYATQSYVGTAISNLVDSAPATLDTLNELAAALGDDPNFATTVTNSIATKLPSSSYTAADVLAKLLTVDGAGSGLDADLLDGLSSNAFVRSNANDTKTGYLEMQDGSANFIALGNGSDFRMWHDGTNTIFRNYNHPDGDMIWQTEGTGGDVHTAMIIKGDTTTPSVELYFDSAKKLETNTGGVEITGTATATTFSGALSGNATTATTLQTARTINGVSFNGSANITVADSTKLPLTGGTLTGTLNGTAADFSGNVDANTITTGVSQTRGKISVWSTSTYGIGMGTGYTFGGIANDYAMTFQMNNANNRGFWWGDDSHTNAQGAMSLTTNGKLTVAHSARIGFGETDTTIPGSTHALEVNGSFAATTKSFVIDHPTKPNMKLRHGSLEGPENGVYVRGRLKDNNVIELPDYWTGLVDEDTITVNLTAIGRGQDLWVEDVAENKVTVGGENINCFYTVFAERKDVERFEVEYEA